MSTQKKISEKHQTWIDARKRFHLSDAHIQMARELGLNPKKFGKLDNRDQEAWKAPLSDFIESIYFKRFGKTRPDQVKSIEQIVKDQATRKAERKAQKQILKNTENTHSTLKLSDKWAPVFVSQPETGLDYQIVTVILKDGRTFEQAVHSGGHISRVRGYTSVPFKEEQIEDIIVTHDKWDWQDWA
jgi:nucleosome binding factor SPN SPT16 subunit